MVCGINENVFNGIGRFCVFVIGFIRLHHDRYFASLFVMEIYNGF